MASSDTERLEALGMLSVYCRSASNLLAADSNGLSDPYLICKTLGQAQRTHVVRKSLNPTWGVTLDFIGCLSDAVSGGLQIEAKDHDTFGKDDPLGAVTVDLGPLMGIDQLHVCQPLPKQGAVNLTVSWLELPPWMLESGVLTVTLEGGVNLLSADSNGYSDPYVKLSLCGQKHKSKHVAKTLNPTWGEHFEFKGTLRELTAAPLHLEAYDYDRFSKADPLGSADVPLGALEVVDMKSFRVALDTQGHVMLSVRWSADAAKSRRAQEEPESSGGVRSSARGGGDESELTLIEQGRLRMRVGAFGLWQERWFELSEEDLTYYASHLDAQPKGVLPLSCLTSIVASPSDGRRLTLRVSAADMDLTKTRAESSLSRASGRLPAVGGGGGRAPNRSPTTKSIELAAPDVVERDRWARILKLLAADGSSLGGGSSTDGSSRGSFGYPLESVSKTPVGDSGLRVPSVLVHLWEALLKRQADGLDSEGIFRLSASADEVARVKAALEAAGASSDAGAALASLTGASGQCLAALIKAYLRELPDDLWGDVRSELEALPLQDWAGDSSEGAASHPAVRAAALKLLSALPPHCSDLILWVCDLMVAVTAREASNRMGLSAVATVFAPGLVPSPHSCTSPMEMFTWTDRGVRLTSLLMRLHMHEPLTTTSTSTAFGHLMDSVKKKGVAEGGRAEPAAADAQQQQKAGPPAAAPVAQAAAVRRRQSVARGEDLAAQEARVAAQGAVYTVANSTGGGLPSHSRTVRRKRHSVEDQRAGLEALLTEIELHPPPESDSAIALDVGERCSYSSDV